MIVVLNRRQGIARRPRILELEFSPVTLKQPKESRSGPLSKDEIEQRCLALVDPPPDSLNEARSRQTGLLSLLNSVPPNGPEAAQVLGYGEMIGIWIMAFEQDLISEP